MPDNVVSLLTIIDNFYYVCSFLELLRNKVGSPLYLSSAYRNKQLNNFVKGAKGSYHLIGKAVDVVRPTLLTPESFEKVIRDTAKDNNFKILELINHKSYIHLAL